MREAWCEKLRTEPSEELVRHIIGRSKLVIPPRAYPTKLEQARSLALALWAWARSGFQISQRIEYRRRRLICAACPQFVKAESRCSVCGCSTKIMPWLKAKKCPEGRWEKRHD